MICDLEKSAMSIFWADEPQLYLHEIRLTTPRRISILNR